MMIEIKNKEYKKCFRMKMQTKRIKH